MDEQEAQYLHPDSWLFWTTVLFLLLHYLLLLLIFALNFDGVLGSCPFGVLAVDVRVVVNGDKHVGVGAGHGGSGSEDRRRGIHSLRSAFSSLAAHCRANSGHFETSIILFLTSEGAERASEVSSAERANKLMDERVTQYLRLDSWLFWPTVSSKSLL